MPVLTLRLLLTAALAVGAGCTVGSGGHPLRGSGSPEQPAGADAQGSSLSLQAWRELSDGATAVAEGRPEDALRAFERAAAHGFDDPMLYFLRGVAHLDLGQATEAVTDLDRSIALDPQDTASYSALARAWRALGDPDAALAALAAGIEATDGDLRLMVLAGHIQLEVGQWGDAFDTLRAVAEVDPDSVEVHRALGVLFAEVGDADRAELSWRSALRLEPNEPLLLAGLGNALRDLGRDEEALACYGAASEAEPDNAVHMANVASALVRLGRLPAARAAYDRALAGDALPPGPRSFVEMNLAHVLERMGEEEGALVAYESAVSGDPALGAAHEALGLMLLDRDDEPHAFEHLLAALDSGRLSAEAALHLGLLAERRGDPEVTRQCARLLELVGETDPVAAFRLAQLMVRASDPEVHDPTAAIPILRGLLAGACAGEAAVWNVLGEALASQGSFAEAARAAGNALQSIDADHPLAGHYEQQRLSYLAHLSDG
jgi:tetratricopeptide (TPR) repeat protein